jgi:hypothetical protein
VLSAIVHPSGQNQQPLNADVIYIARSWDPTMKLPLKAKMPWAANFVSDVLQWISNQPKQSFESTSLDIVNPYKSPLELARLSGRISFSQLSDSTNMYTWPIVEDPVYFRSLIVNVRLRSSRGFDIAREPTSFDSLFPYNWRTWEIPEKWQMAPGEFYRAHFDVAQAPSGIGMSNSGQGQISIGLTGYRDVLVSDI